MKVFQNKENKYWKYVYTSDPVLLNPPGSIYSARGGSGFTIYDVDGNWWEAYLMLNPLANTSYPRWQASAPGETACIKFPWKCKITSYTTKQVTDSEAGRICNHWIIKGYNTDQDCVNKQNGIVIDTGVWETAAAGTSKTITINNPQPYQNYSIQMVNNFLGSSYCSMGATQFYGIIPTIVEGTASDYDFIGPDKRTFVHKQSDTYSTPLF